MDLYLPSDIADKYKNASQKARIMTESWALTNLYCPVCDFNSINETRTNTKVVDFYCLKCNSIFQLKSKKDSLGRKIIDSAYDSMIKAIMNDNFPHLLLLVYCPSKFKVKHLLLIPNYCISASAIEARKPLSNNARRAGWIGCNILLDSIPPDGRIEIIASQTIIPRTQVRKQFTNTIPLKKISAPKRGWTLDVLNQIRSLNKDVFSLNDAYSKDYISG